MQAERPVHAEMVDLFGRQEEEVIGRLEDQWNERRQEGPTITLESLFDVLKWEESTVEATEPLLLDAIRDGYQAAFMRVDADLSGGNVFSTHRPIVRQTLQKVNAKSKLTAQTTNEQLSDTLQEGLMNDEGIGELTARVQSVFEDAKSNRARTIAQTSSNAAFEAGQKEGFQAADIDTRLWLSQRDGRVRDTHMRADTQKRDMNTPFDVGGHKLMHPGDPDGPPSEVINCRCSQLPLLEEDDE